MASVLATELRAKSTGVALAYHAKLLDFTSVRNIKFVFNPFHERVQSIRHTLFQMSVPKRRRSNFICRFKVDVRSERCDPQMEVTFMNGHKAVFKTQYLPTATILQEFNRLCQEHDVKKAANQ